MSVYCPDPRTLYPARLIDGWWIMDKHGPLSGPYASIRDVNRGIADARDDYYYGPVLNRHSSYGEG